MLDVKELADFERILREHRVVLADFYAEWCAPCQVMAPLFNAMANKFGQHLTIAKCNADECGQIMKKYGVSAIPTFILFFEGKKVNVVYGVEEKELINLFTEAFLLTQSS